MKPFDILLEACKAKLSEVTPTVGFKLIYMWVKQDHINLDQFKKLIKHNMDVSI